MNLEPLLNLTILTNSSLGIGEEELISDFLFPLDLHEILGTTVMG